MGRPGNVESHVFGDKNWSPGHVVALGAGQPRAWLWQGLYEWLAGKPGKARKAWHKSLAAAERLAMRYEQGLAHYEIGGCLGKLRSALKISEPPTVFGVSVAPIANGSPDDMRLQESIEAARDLYRAGSPARDPSLAPAR